MDKVAGEAIQVFCPICARGVLIRNESMYKCPRCQREVCRPCFDKEHRLCVDCCGPLLKGKPRVNDAADRPDPDGPPLPQAPSRDRTRDGIWLLVAGVVLIAAAMLLSLFLSIPNWLMTILAGIACVLFVLGMTRLLKG